MAAGVDSSGSGRIINAVAMEFSINNDDDVEKDSISSSPSPQKIIPKRLRARLIDSSYSKSPPTVEDIEAKLRLADLRRRQFYENLSSKARPKCRSPSRSSSNEDDLGQRLEAKLEAAEKKRLSILECARVRLARLDELRQAAKTGVVLRSEKKRKELRTKVESRVQQAEANRKLLLKAYRQRRDTLKERTSQSILRRIARENKYKERVRASIHQKRAAAEKKRMDLLEAEKKRAHARLLQVWRVAKTISNQREIERRQLKDKLEDRLQRAKRQRAEYLRQRGRMNDLNSNKVDKQADILSSKLARVWKRFLRQRKTTLELAKGYEALQVHQNSIRSMPFEQLAVLIESTATLQTMKALLDRFESRIRVSRIVSEASNSFSIDNIDHLLKRVASPNKKPTPNYSSRKREAKKVGSTKEIVKNSAKMSRYQVRVVLCAYMIMGHPDAVFSGRGEREFSLAKSAENFVKDFELLLKIILEGPIQSSDEESDITAPKRSTFRSQLAAFDQAWCTYLNCFVVWKVKDAKLLEDDLVRAACHLELSMMQTCKLTPDGDNIVLTHDMKAVQKQVSEDQNLLREKVQHLSGNDGIERMECAIADTRSKYFQARAKGSLVGSPITSFLSPGLSSFPAVHSPASSLDQVNSIAKGIESSTRVVRSLFREEGSSQANKTDMSLPRTKSDGRVDSSGEHLAVENEFIVNEVVHEQQYALSDRFNVTDEGEQALKTKIKESMEKAFWDEIIESMEQDKPNYDRVFELIMEVRDDLCEMSPQSWKQEILAAIDLDILSQVLKVGNLDVAYLGNILNFALVTLQRLSAPANDEELKETHQKLFKELAEIHQARYESKHSLVNTLMKGLRFVLEQIQVLKREISKARIRMMEPFLKGPAGLEYLKKAFANHYGSPSDAFTSLPLTAQWVSSVWSCKDHEWAEHKSSFSGLTNHAFLPSTTLRTGGSLLVKTNGSQANLSPSSSMTGNQQTQCIGENIDLLVRLGLLKLVSGVTGGLTQEGLPETLKLNISRLRTVQAQIQEIIVISTSVLIFRQILLTEQPIPDPNEMESAILDCFNRLSELLQRVQDAGIEQIVETISSFSTDNDNIVSTEKLQSRKMVMGRMLAKGLQAGDPVFERVSLAIYLALRGIVLGGSGPQGCKLAEMALKQIGAGALTRKVVEAGEVLVVAATVSVNIHGEWYTHLIDTM